MTGLLCNQIISVRIYYWTTMVTEVTLLMMHKRATWFSTYQHLSTFWSNTQRLMWSIQLFHWIPQNQLSLIFIPTWTARDQNLPAPLTPKILPSNRPAAIRALWILSGSKTWLPIFLLGAINHEYRDGISGFTPVVSKSAVAAYLTIEFKKDEHNRRERERAKHQASAASAMSPHHRVILRQKRLAAEKTRPPLTSKISSIMPWPCARHFYTSWLTQYPQWRPTANHGNGCTMPPNYAYNAKLGSEEKVMRFAQWLNEIHNWAFGPLGRWVFFLDNVKIDCVGGRV